MMHDCLGNRREAVEDVTEDCVTISEGEMSGEELDEGAVAFHLILVGVQRVSWVMG